MEFTGEPEASALMSSDDFKNSEDYLYAIDLLNFGHYWESHAYLEALWNAHGRHDDFAILFKAIIKIAAGLLKRELGNEKACQIHLNRCLELLNELDDEEFCGINLEELKILVSHMLSKALESTPEFIIKLRL